MMEKKTKKKQWNASVSDVQTCPMKPDDLSRGFLWPSSFLALVCSCVPFKWLLQEVSYNMSAVLGVFTVQHTFDPLSSCRMRFAAEVISCDIQVTLCSRGKVSSGCNCVPECPTTNATGALRGLLIMRLGTKMYLVVRMV